MNVAKVPFASASKPTTKSKQQTKQGARARQPYNTRSAKQQAESNVQEKNTEAVSKKVMEGEAKQNTGKAAEAVQPEQNKTIESKNNELLQQLVQLLALKIQADETRQTLKLRQRVLRKLYQTLMEKTCQ